MVTCPDIFVLLVYLTWRCGLQGRIALQMEMRDGIVLEVNATCSEIEGHRLLTAAWSPCIHYSLQHSVLHCRQGYNFNAENTEGVGFRGYQAVCGRRVFLRQSEAVELFIAALYEQPSSRSMAQAQYTKIMYTRMQIRISMSLLPTDLVICLHLKRVHFQMFLAEDQLGSLGVSISQNMAGRSKME